jgi:rRNA methylase
MSDRTRPPAVAVIEPQTPGNVGTIARGMKNFGFEELLVIDGPPLEPDGEAYGFAGQAREDVLPNHARPSFEKLVDSYHTVGFTARTNQDATRHVRFPFVPVDKLSQELAPVKTDVAFVFGREDNGLTNAELARLDQVCSIPASAAYPSLNLGQAVTVALYETQQLAREESQLPDPTRDRANESEIERLYDRIEQFLAAIDHPKEKQAKTMRLVRRLIGRTHPTDREVVTLTGVFRRGAQRAETTEDTN